MAANFYLHTRLAEVDVAVTAQLKAHRVLHNPMKPLRIADKKVRRSEAIREVWVDGQGEPAGSQFTPRTSGLTRIGSLRRQTACTSTVPTDMIGSGTWEGPHVRHEAAGVRHTARRCSVRIAASHTSAAAGDAGGRISQFYIA